VLRHSYFHANLQRAAIVLLALGLTQRIQFLAREEERSRLESEGKSQFIAHVSHELRTPMNGVLGMPALLRDHLFEPKVFHYNNVIYQSGLALLSIINGVLDAATTDAPTPLAGQFEGVTPFDSSSEKPLTILVAEDNATNQLVVEKVVEKMGHSARIVSNGKEALNAITDNPDMFDLVLMDCEMPVMNGYTATIEIREYEPMNNRKPIPIVALTANAM